MFEYIKYRWKAKGRHGTHSPFIYKLVDECLAIDIKKEDDLQIKALYHQLKSNKKIIQVSDFGAGSKSLKNERKISSIFKISSSKGKYAKLFYQLSSYYSPKKILELGTSLGIGTIHFSKGNPTTEIITLEACPATARIAQQNFDSLSINNIQLINQTFDNYLIEKPNLKFDFIFIDGHHDGNALQQYIKQLDSTIHDETFIIVDDIRWSESMFNAWNMLKNNHQFNVSIDLFRMGILLKRPGQRKEHFIVRL